MNSIFSDLVIATSNELSKKAATERSLQVPSIVTSSKTLEFWEEKDFWKDKNPVDIEEFVEKMLDMAPSQGQREILRVLAGTDPFEWNTAYQLYAIAIGQGGGKNKYIIAPFTGYLAYKIANMTNPWKYFSRFFRSKLDTSVRFEMCNSSMVTERQARNVHFSNMISLIKRCKLNDGRNWFEVFAAMDMREAFGDIKMKSIEIPTQSGCGSIVLHSFDSTPTAPEGLSLILGIIDEPSRADTPAAYEDVKLLWNVIKGNLNTRFGGGVGKAIAFSYLNNSQYDFMETLLKEADEQKKSLEYPILYGINRSTFEMNPNVSKEDRTIVAAYRTDPIDAKARYEGIKGLPREGFYQPHVEKIRECFFETESPVEYEYGIVDRKVDNPSTMTREVRRFLKIDITKIRGDNRMRCWSYDPAEKFDAFVLKGGYVETIDEMRDELFIENRSELVVINKRPIIDVVLVWQPSEGLTVDYLNVGDIIGILLQKFPNSQSVNSDKYNSAKLNQEILARGVQSKTYSFSSAQQFKMYSILRWLFWNNIPQIGYDKKHSIAKRGIVKTVGEWNLEEHERLLRDGNKVYHPEPYGSKDLSDCDVMLVNDLIQLEVTGQFVFSEYTNPTDPKMMKLVDRYLVERQRLKNAGVRLSEHPPLLAKTLGMSIADVRSLIEYVEMEFSGLL